jgi:hypothetical protein
VRVDWSKTAEDGIVSRNLIQRRVDLIDSAKE